MRTTTQGFCFVACLFATTNSHADQILFRDDFNTDVSPDLVVANHEGDRSVVNGRYQWTPTANLSPSVCVFSRRVACRRPSSGPVVCGPVV